MKKALCIGINDYPGTQLDLKGCVNDARSWADLLRNQYGFEPRNVRLMLDGEATKAAILQAFDDLVKDAAEGDVLVFTNSSHGTYLPDADGDESDGRDEALCPVDCRVNVIVDDELNERIAKIPSGVHFTMISDSCHSGSVTRRLEPASETPRRARFMNPGLIREATGAGIEAAGLPKKPVRRAKRTKALDVLLSGCGDAESSYDAMIDGQYHGAMSYYALRSLQESNYRMTYAQLQRKVSSELSKAGYPQHPKLMGKTAMKAMQVFS